MSKNQLEGIYIGSGVSAKTKEPFCHVTCQTTDGTFIEAQLDPESVRRMALDWLEAAEGAIHDAAVYKMLCERMNVGDHEATMFIGELREFRQDKDRMIDVPEEETNS